MLYLWGTERDILLTFLFHLTVWKCKRWFNQSDFSPTLSASPKLWFTASFPAQTGPEEASLDSIWRWVKLIPLRCYWELTGLWAWESPGLKWKASLHLWVLKTYLWDSAPNSFSDARVGSTMHERAKPWAGLHATEQVIGIDLSQRASPVLEGHCPQILSTFGSHLSARPQIATTCLPQTAYGVWMGRGLWAE